MTRIRVDGLIPASVQTRIGRALGRRTDELERGKDPMKRDVTLTITSLVSILFVTFHLAQDTLHAHAGSPEAGGSTLAAVPILVVWLYGTLLLAERRSGYVIMLIGSVIAMAMPVFHIMGPRGFFTGEFAKYSGAFLFFWSFFVLSVAGMLSFILCVQGLWGLRRTRAG